MTNTEAINSSALAPEQIIYIDHSEVREGKLEQLKIAIKELSEFVKVNEPRIIAYNVYFSEDGRRMTVVHIHHDAASLEFHMKVGGKMFARFAEFVRLLTINVYGNPGDDLVDQLRGKARTLGNGTVVVHSFHAGFARF